jgi:hypothetical protein
MRCRLIPLALALLAIAGCSRSEKSQTGENLRSDIPLRTIQYLSEHPEEAKEVQAMCDQWKGSQRPIASWPAVVTENCNNAGAARLRNLQREQRERMKKQMGI